MEQDKKGDEMANIFSNLGPGLAKVAGDQSKFSKIINGDTLHFNNQQELANKKLAKQGRKQGLENVSETGISSMKRNVKDYLTAQDLNYKDTVGMRNTARAVRMGGVAAVAGTAVLAPRYMSGGTATMNNRGEQDIAGIPFI